MVAAEERAVYFAVFFEHNKVSAITSVPAYDSGTGDAGFSMV
jgi:hypothetical protein